VVGTGSSGVQIAAALSAEAANLDVYQRTPAWVLPKIDFDIPPLMRRTLRWPGVVACVNVAGRLTMDAFMVAPIVHLFSRLPDYVLARLLPLHDGYCRALYRLLLRTSSTTRRPVGRWSPTTASWPSAPSSPATFYPH